MISTVPAATPVVSDSRVTPHRRPRAAVCSAKIRRITLVSAGASQEVLKRQPAHRMYCVPPPGATPAPPPVPLRPRISLEQLDLVLQRRSRAEVLMHSLPLAPQPLQPRAHRGRIPARRRRAAVHRPPARLRGRARAPSRAPAFGVLGRPLCDVGLAVAPLVLLVQPVVVGNLNLIATKVSEAVAAAPPTEERLFEGSVTTF